jgi:hypothetical protein
LAQGADFAYQSRFLKFAFVKKILSYTITVSAAVLLLCAPAERCAAQQAKGKDKFLHYIVEGKDTIYVDEIRASKVYSRLPKQKGKEWRKYYRLVHNFSKTYPYALAARNIIRKADKDIEDNDLKRLKRDRYINNVQDELFEMFEEPLRNLTVSQGALLMKLIDREIGKSSYMIIKDYKNGIAAKFWQGVAKLFGSDLKKPYDPEGEDRKIEELVEIWDAGDFEAFYFSLFWKDPPTVEIPSKYR